MQGALWLFNLAVHNHVSLALRDVFKITEGDVLWYY